LFLRVEYRAFSYVIVLITRRRRRRRGNEKMFNAIILIGYRLLMMLSIVGMSYGAIKEEPIHFWGGAILTVVSLIRINQERNDQNLVSLPERTEKAGK